MQEFGLERMVMFSFGLGICGFMKWAKARSENRNVAALGGRDFGVQICGVCGPLRAPAGAKHIHGGCRMGWALPCGLHLSSFPYPFLLLPHLWVTAACKPAVKVCYCWTSINLKVLEKSAGKLKTFLEVRKTALWMAKKKIGVETQNSRGKIYFYKIRWLRKFPRGRRIRCFLHDSEWQLFSCTVAWQLCFPREKQGRKERLTLFSER